MEPKLFGQKAKFKCEEPIWSSLKIWNEPCHLYWFYYQELDIEFWYQNCKNYKNMNMVEIFLKSPNVCQRPLLNFI